MSDPWYARMAREAQELEETATEREHGIPEPSDPRRGRDMPHML
jgi:hypothetical protein